MRTRLLIRNKPTGDHIEVDRDKATDGSSSSTGSASMTATRYRAAVLQTLQTTVPSKSSYPSTTVTTPSLRRAGNDNFNNVLEREATMDPDQLAAHNAANTDWDMALRSNGSPRHNWPEPRRKSPPKTDVPPQKKPVPPQKMPWFRSPGMWPANSIRRHIFYCDPDPQTTRAPIRDR